LIANNLKAYIEAPTRREKSQIIDDVASQIRCYGGFVKKTSSGRWLAIGPAQSREKVGHGFRDCMKLFKGQKPKSKQVQWKEAQNAIFVGLNLQQTPLTTDHAPAPTRSLPPTPVFPLRAVSEEPLDVQSDFDQGMEELPIHEIDCDFEDFWYI
jgi:hypothetical protein